MFRQVVADLSFTRSVPTNQLILKNRKNDFLLFNASCKEVLGVNVDGNKKRNKIIMLSATVCVAVALITFAASRSEKKIENSFVAAGAGIVIVENSTEVSSETNSIDFAVDENNYTAAKAVSIKNTGGSNPIPVFVRVCIFPRFETDGYELQTGITGESFPTSITDNRFTIDGVTFKLVDGWSTNWSYKNGYFYYKNNNGVLDVGETTEQLLESVSVNKTDYTNNFVNMGSQLKVVVLADSIQTVGLTRESTNQSAVVQRWGDVGLTGQDVARPTESEQETETAATAFGLRRVLSADLDDVVSPSAIVITNYEKQRINNMITSITVYGPPEADYYEEEEETEEGSEESIIEDTADVQEEEDTAVGGENDEVEESEIIGEE
jgi:hypothetical protein